MKKQRKQYAPEEKVAILALRRYLECGLAEPMKDRTAAKVH